MKDYRVLNSSKVEPPPFFDKLTKKVSESWDSYGSIGCKINKISDTNYEILFFPALREVYGGKSDGEVIFPGFNFNIGKFVRVFDESPAPKVRLDCLRKQFITHLQFKGNIDGITLKIKVLECPPCGQQAVERVYTDGPKKGKIEVIE